MSQDAGGALGWVSPHVQLLCAAAQPVAPVDAVAWPAIDWARALSLTAYERAEVAVARCCQAAPAGAVPAPVLAQLHGLAQVRRFTAAGLAAAADQVAAIAAAAAVPVVWLKGAALARRHPEGFGVRGMGDLDLLVPAHAARRLFDRLVAAGWTPGADVEAYATHHHLPPLQLGPDVRVELHTELFMPGHPFRGADGARWLAPDRADGEVLRPAWHLVHAAIHWAWSSEGMIGSWQWLHDAAWLSSVHGDDCYWAEVVAASEGLGAGPVVGWALWTAWALGVGTVPRAVVDRLRPVRLGQPVVAREWVARAWVAGGPVRSVRWTRLLWRRALGPVARDPRRLPWQLGRGALAPAGGPDRDGGGAGRGPGGGPRMA